jgi:parallel beta-helix repeat protein
MFTFLVAVLLCAAILIPIIVMQTSKDKSIIIRSNSDFRKYNLLGSGTSIDPYIIENNTIKTSNDYAIFIADVTEYFIVRNNNLQAATAAISISLVAANRTQLINNTCRNSKIGIYISSSPGSYIFGNNCSNNFIDGIQIESSGYEEDTSYYNITNNTCINNVENSIVIWKTPYVKVENNTCIMLNKNVLQIYHRCGIVLFQSGHAIVRNNIIKNTGIQFGNHPVYLITSIFEDNIINGKEFGLFYNTNNITIDSSNYGQLYFFNCSDIEIRDQIIIDNYTPLELENCKNIQIINSSFNYNYKYGITLRACQDVLIQTTESSHNYMGAFVWYSTNVTIDSCIFTNNYVGCFVDQSTYTLIDNTFSDNVDDFIEV